MNMPLQETARLGMDDVELARALIYRLLGRALAEPADAGFLARLAHLDGGDGEVGTALRDVAAAARAATPEAAKAEYDALFIGVARGELVPYASFYLTGFLHERPLARVRAEMQALGLARAGGRSDPEDHIASECEIMAMLINRGDAGAQSGFFERHLAPWADRFFADLERAASAVLFRPIGALGRLMTNLDRQGFALAAGASTQKGAACPKQPSPPRLARSAPTAGPSCAAQASLPSPCRCPPRRRRFTSQRTTRLRRATRKATM